MNTRQVRSNKGFHPVVEGEFPYVFIDSCMQAWPDADYGNAHRHAVTAYGVTAWLPHASVEGALEGLMYWHLVARQHPNLLVIEEAEDIRRAKREGRAGFLLAAQDGDFIGSKLHRVEAFYRLGLRMMLPAYNRTNLICGGCLDRADGGLTSFGRRVVEESNRVGLLLDCTHVGRRSSLEIIEWSERPVVFSHSNPQAVAESPRNIDDEQIRACAERGGVIGLAPFGPLVMKGEQSEWPTLDDFIDHVDHVVQLLGSSEHVGLGTDMSLGTYPDHQHDPWGEPEYPKVGEAYSRHVTGDVRSPKRALQNFNSFAHAPELVRKLRERGYEEKDVRNLFGQLPPRVLAGVAVGSMAPQAGDGTLYLTAQRLVEGTDGPALEEPIIRIEGQRIHAVTTRSTTDLPVGARVIDLGARTLLPGLIDAHTHCGVSTSSGSVLRSLEPSQRKLIRAVRAARALLDAGITATRDLGYHDAIHLRDAIEAGEVVGPRMSCPRAMITQSGGSPDPHWLPRTWAAEHDYRVSLADGVSAVQRAAREQIRGGADFLKIMASGGLGERHDLEASYHYTIAELEAIVEEGHKLGLKVAAHAVGAEAVKNCLKAGVDTIEHGSYLDEEAIDLLVQSRAIYVPTLSILDAFANADEDANIAPRARDLARRSLDRALESVRSAWAAGVRIAAGTDFGSMPLTPAGKNWREAELLVQAGLSPRDAVTAFTVTSAEAMDRRSDLGSVEPGMYADIIAAPIDPTVDITSLRDIDFVLKGGQVIREPLEA